MKLYFICLRASQRYCFFRVLVCLECKKKNLRLDKLITTRRNKHLLQKLQSLFSSENHNAITEAALFDKYLCMHESWNTQLKHICSVQPSCLYGLPYFFFHQALPIQHRSRGIVGMLSGGVWERPCRARLGALALESDGLLWKPTKCQPPDL